jgi:hypothetical protein
MIDFRTELIQLARKSDYAGATINPPKNFNLNSLVFSTMKELRAEDLYLNPNLPELEKTLKLANQIPLLPNDSQSTSIIPLNTMQNFSPSASARLIGGITGTSLANNNNMNQYGKINLF